MCVSMMHVSVFWYVGNPQNLSKQPGPRRLGSTTGKVLHQVLRCFFRPQKSDPPVFLPSKKMCVLFFLCIRNYSLCLIIYSKPSMKFSWNSIKFHWEVIVVESMHSFVIVDWCRWFFCDCNDFPTINHAIPQGPTPDIIHGLNIQFVRLFFCFFLFFPRAKGSTYTIHSKYIESYAVLWSYNINNMVQSWHDLHACVNIYLYWLYCIYSTYIFMF